MLIYFKVIYKFMAKKYKIASKKIVNIVKSRVNAAKVKSTRRIVNIIRSISEKRRAEQYFFMRKEFSDESFCSNREGMESWGEKKFSSKEWSFLSIPY